MNYSRKGISDKQKKMNSKSTKLSTKLGVLVVKVLLVLALAVGVTGTCAAYGMFKGLIENAPDISTIDLTPIGYATKVYNAEGQEVESLVREGANRISASIDEMPKHLVYAFIDIEDERFMEHNGIDIKGIIRAGVYMFSTGNTDQGASTITQQLIKNKIFNTGMGENTFMDKLKRKLQEQYLAVELSKMYSKEEILENYLNMINLGNNTLGVQSAARRYFNKDVWDLTISESAVIAAITQNPTSRDPIMYPDKNNERRMDVLNKMLKFGHITQKEYDEALADDVYARIQDVNVAYQSESSVFTYYTDALIDVVMKDLQERLGYSETQAYLALWSGGLSIYTPQSPQIQAICDEEYLNEENFPQGTEYSVSWAWSIQHADGTKDNYSEYSLESYFRNGDEEHGLSPNRFFKAIFDSTEQADEYIATFKENHLSESDIELGETIFYTPQPQSSFVIMDQSNGYVKAIVGGRGEKQTSRSLNRAVDTYRQPGSTFKIVSTYAAALDTAGFTLASVQYDEAGYTSPDGNPFVNYNARYTGYTTIRDAIARSVNIVAVKTLVDITPSLGFSYLKNFGFSTLVESQVYNDGTSYTDIGFALALGGLTKGVTNLDLTASYAAIANGGVYIEPIFYTKVLDHNGNVLLENKPETRRVIKETTAFLLTDAMKDVINYGTGTACRLGNMAVSGKSGSTSDYNDVWFSGYTPYYTASIWSGYDMNKSQSGVRASYHKDLWTKIMKRVHENLEYKDFVRPEGIETAVICTKSGKLAIEGTCNHDPRGSMVATEYFAKGTVPTEYCDNHVKVTICTVSGEVAGENCPAETLEERVYISSTNLKISENLPEENNNDEVRVIGNSEEIDYMLPENMLEHHCMIHEADNGFLPETPTDFMGIQGTEASETGKPTDVTMPTAPSNAPIIEDYSRQGDGPWNER